MPNLPTVIIGENLPNTAVELRFQAHVGYAIFLRIQYNDQIWESWEEPTIPTSVVYQKAAELTKLNEQQFKIMWQVALLPRDDSITLGLIVHSELPAPITLQVHEGPTVQIYLPNMDVPALVFTELPDTPISKFFPLVAAKLPSPYSFYLSSDSTLLYSSDSEVHLNEFLKTDGTPADFYVIPADSVLKIAVADPNYDDTTNHFGFPHDISVGRVWQVLEVYYPKMVGFPDSEAIIHRAQDLSDGLMLDPTLLSSLIPDSETNRVLNIKLYSPHEVIFASLKVEGRDTKPMCVFFDVEVCDVLYFALGEENQQFDFTGPDGEEIEKDGIYYSVPFKI